MRILTSMFSLFLLVPAAPALAKSAASTPAESPATMVIHTNLTAASRNVRVELMKSRGGSDAPSLSTIQKADAAITELGDKANKDIMQNYILKPVPVSEAANAVVKSVGSKDAQQYSKALVRATSIKVQKLEKKIAKVEARRERQSVFLNVANPQYRGSESSYASELARQKEDLVSAQSLAAAIKATK